MPITYDISDFISGNIFGFMLLFMRLGAACMFFPGVGESFISARNRLMFALAFTFLLFPVLGPQMPAMPASVGRMAVLVSQEIMVGVFLGLIVRILVMALEFAGQAIALQLGLGNAFAFNPAMATQGSLPGALMGLLAMVLVFATQMHHLLFRGLVESYALMPAGGTPEIKDMSMVITSTVSKGFSIGVMIAAPFFIVGTLLQIGMGLLSRMQPSLQVFFVALPLQILLGLGIFGILLGTIMAFWLDQTADGFIAIGLG